MKSLYNNLSARGKRFFIGFAFIFLSLFAVQVAELLWHYYQTALVRYSAVTISYENPFSDLDVLIAGDSTGVGAGASKPEESIAGLFIKDGASVLNTSHSGDRTHEVLDQVRNVNPNRHFDLALIFTGGNDILWFRGIDDTSEYLRELIREAKKRSDKVVVIPPGNVGIAPIFREPVGIFYTGRARDLRDQFMQVSSEEEVLYLDTFSDSLSELFGDEPLKYFSPDLLHPSSEGYKIWYERIRDLTNI